MDDTSSPLFCYIGVVTDLERSPFLHLTKFKHTNLHKIIKSKLPHDRPHENVFFVAIISRTSEKNHVLQRMYDEDDSHVPCLMHLSMTQKGNQT